MLYSEQYVESCNIPGFYLLLNPNYDRAESIRAFGPFTTPAEALEFHDQERIKDAEGTPACECIEGDRISYSFRSGSLRHMNCLASTERDGESSRLGHGVAELREIFSVGWFSTALHPSMQAFHSLTKGVSQ